MSFLLGLWNKASVYMIAVGIVVIALAAAVMSIRADGATSEKLKQAQRTLEAKKLEAQVRDEIAATDAAVNRKRLRDRWSKR